MYRSQRKAAALLPSSPVSSSSPDGARQPARQRTSPASPSSTPRETSFLRLGQSCWPFQRRAGNKDRRVCTVYLNVTERRAAARKPYPARLPLSLQAIVMEGSTKTYFISFSSIHPRGEHTVLWWITGYILPKDTASFDAYRTAWYRVGRRIRMREPRKTGYAMRREAGRDERLSEGV